MRRRIDGDEINRNRDRSRLSATRIRSSIGESIRLSDLSTRIRRIVKGTIRIECQLATCWLLNQNGTDNIAFFVRRSCQNTIVIDNRIERPVASLATSVPSAGTM